MCRFTKALASPDAGVCWPTNRSTQAYPGTDGIDCQGHSEQVASQKGDVGMKLWLPLDMGSVGALLQEQCSIKKGRPMGRISAQFYSVKKCSGKLVISQVQSELSIKLQ